MRVLRILQPLLVTLAALDASQQLDCVEYFSGVQSVTGGFKYLGMSAAGIDKADDPERTPLLACPFGAMAMQPTMSTCRHAPERVWCLRLGIAVALPLPCPNLPWPCPTLVPRAC
eukprot:7907607-Alexandrium_andersonii.AAC.1